MTANLTEDERDNILLACRYGDLEDVKHFVETFSAKVLADVRDDNENTILHMTCGNGHLDILEYLLPLIPPSLLAAQNNAKSTALHWAAVNCHLPIVQKLVEFKEGLGVDLIDIKNTAGRSPLAEAEFAGWDEGATWLVKMMNIDTGDTTRESSSSDAVDEEETEAGDASRDIAIEIEDADGQVAKMTLRDESK